MANGFNLIADDFVPIDTFSKVRFFPAALSVKKQALNTLSEDFPELINAKEIHFKQLNKTVRYLASKNDFSMDSYPTKAIVFIKYKQDITFELNEMPTIEAFQEFVPDTWISPISENAKKFLDWFSTMPCYRLTYSDNDKLVSEIKHLFNE